MALTDEDKEYFETLVMKASEHSTVRVETTMKKCLIAIGIDIDKPIEVQKDMALLRMIRNFSESMITKAIAFLIASVTLAGLGWKFMVKK